MFTTLPESCAPRSRRFGGTIASLLAHGLIGAAVVGFSVARQADARLVPVGVDRHSPVYVPVSQPVRPSSTARGGRGGAPPLPVPPRIAASQFFTDVQIPLMPERVPFVTPDTLGLVRGTGLSLGGSVVGEQGDAGIVNELETGRAPQLRGVAVQPRYPDALRAAGITGRVVVQFVVDTLGRAEPGMEVIQGDRAEFVEAVRTALPRFHFTPGEAAGRKVRTRVQIPFDFTLR